MIFHIFPFGFIDNLPQNIGIGTDGIQEGFLLCFSNHKTGIKTLRILRKIRPILHGFT